jgi:hypothetical protein
VDEHSEIYAGRGKSTGLADAGHLAAYADRLDQQPVVSVLLTV